MKRRILTYGMFLLVGIMLITCSAHARPEITGMLGHNEPEGSVPYFDMQLFLDLVELRSEGRIKFEQYPGGVLGGAAAQVDMVRAGAIQMQAQVSAIIDVVEEESYWDLPYFFDSRDQVSRIIMSPLREEIEENYRAYGLELLGYFDLGFRHHINNVRPVYLPEDLQGVTWRGAVGGTKGAVWRNYDISPAAVSYMELYEALDHGIVDGFSIPVANIYSGRFYEVQDYLSLTGILYNPIILVANADWFAGLPEWAQQIVKECAYEAAAASRYRGEMHEKELLAAMEDKIAINSISAEERQVWFDQARPVYDSFAQDRLGEDFFRRLYKVVKGEEWDD